MIFSADIEDWQQSVRDFKRPVSKRVVHNKHRLLATRQHYYADLTQFTSDGTDENQLASQLTQAIAKPLCAA